MKRRIPRQLPPTAVERQLVAASIGFAHRLADAVRAVVPRLLEILELERSQRRLDDPIALVARGQSIQRRIDAGDAPAILTDAIAQALDVSAIREAARVAGRGADAHNRRQIGRQVAAAIGVDVTTGDASIPTLLRQFAEEYAAQIVDVGDELRRRTAATVAAGITSSQTAAQVAAELLRVTELAPERAKRIARDQLGKVHGAINQARQHDLGVKSYVWRTSRDRRVRGKPGGAYPHAKPSHDAREGKTYRWSDPPPGGHPGEAILCRCHAEPVLDELLELEREVAPDTTSPVATPEYSTLRIGTGDDPIVGYRHRTIEVAETPTAILPIGLASVRAYVPPVAPVTAPRLQAVDPVAVAAADERRRQLEASQRRARRAPRRSWTR